MLFLCIGVWVVLKKKKRRIGDVWNAGRRRLNRSFSDEWEAEVKKHLGTDTDEVIAKKFGCSRNTINKRRLAEGIPAFGGTGINNKLTEEFWSEWDYLLGTMPDKTLAKIVGVSGTTITRRRYELGVACFEGCGAVNYIQAARLLSSWKRSKQLREFVKCLSQDS